MTALKPALTALSCCLLASHAQALTVVSTYAEDTVASLLRDFQAQRPGARLTVISRRADLIQRGVESGSLRHADVVLTSSPFLLQGLKRAGLLLPLAVGQREGRCVPPGLALLDPQRQFASYGVSGFGLLWNNRQLRQLGVAPPSRWQDLLQPALHGKVLMSTPARSSTTHIMVEKVLQDQGWQAGWSLLLRLAGNMPTIASRSHSVAERINDGEVAAAPMLDSSARPFAESGHDFEFRYFPSFAVIPTYVALLKGGEERAQAQALARYLFSPRGQLNLLRTAHFKLPLNDWPQAPQSQAVCRALRQQRPVDEALLLAREKLVQELYDQLITRNSEQLRDTWELIQQAGLQSRLSPEQGRWLAQARRLAADPPLAAAQAADPAYLAAFNRDPRRARQEALRWQQAWQAQLNQAAQLARRALVATHHD